MTMLWESLIDYALIWSASRNGPQSVCKNKMTIATLNNRKSEPGTAHRCLKASYAVTLVGVVLTLTGCAVGPHYVKPVLGVNDSWSGTGSPQDLGAAGQRTAHGGKPSTIQCSNN